MTAEPLHPCARCAQLQRTCCQQADVLLTTRDIDRIARHSGRRDFWSRRAPGDPATTQHDPDDPDWLTLTLAPDGTRALLNRLPEGDCTFLGPRGCTLPIDVRPLVCRLYPYSYNARGLVGEAADYCPRDRLAPAGNPAASMLTILDMRRSDAEVWRRQLYHELTEGGIPSCDSP